MSKARVYKVVTFFSGSGFKTLGLLRSRSALGSRFVSIGAFDLDELACADFEIMTGHRAQVVDLGVINPEQLAERCDGEPDVVVMSPPCTGYSGCLGESLSKTEKYKALNELALRAINLALETWTNKPGIILLENVPRMVTRGADILAQIIALLRAAGYEVDLRPHDCGEWGGLAQSRQRLLLVARLRSKVASHMLMPPNLGLRPMSEVLWQLPVPLPGSDAGGRLHRLPKLAPINWVRLAGIRSTKDWRDIPSAIRYQQREAKPRVRGRKTRQNGGFGVNDDRGPAHSVLGERGIHNVMHSVTDPRIAKKRFADMLGVQDPAVAGKTVLGDGTIHNSASAVADPRLGHAPRDGGALGVEDPAGPGHTVLGVPGIHNGFASICDPRSECKRYDNALGVSNVGAPYKSPIIGSMQIHNNPSSICDPRLAHDPRRGSYEVQDPARPSKVVRGEHSIRQAPSAIADGRLFVPTHHLLAGQALDVSRDEWVNGDFELVGPPIAIRSKGRACWLVIVAPDGTFHRPMTTLELAMLMGAPVWHRPGDPTELAIGEEGGQWLDLHGNDAQVRKHVGNGVPIPTATAMGNTMLEVLDAGTNEIFRLSSGGVWVAPESESVTA